MKKLHSIVLFLFISFTTLSQGIAIQGIARDNVSSAIANANLTFTFSITEVNNTVLYAETQSIRTDNFGVFSHIFGTGNPIKNTFSGIDFSIQGLKLKVSVNYSGSVVEVYNQTLQSTPYAQYAKKAANGVPTGAVMPFLGPVAVLCNGQSIT